MIRVVPLGVCLVLAVGCAARMQGSADGASDRITAARIYAAAEERYTAGAFDEAAALMQRAVLQLPAEAEHDVARHQLVLRLGHTLLRAHDASGEITPLLDAHRMLTRYLYQHVESFGTNERAERERGQVSELLATVEAWLEAVELAEPEPAEPEPAEPESAASVDEDGQPEERRQIVVHSRPHLASIEDPVVMGRLRSDFTEVPNADIDADHFSMTDPPGAHLARGLDAAPRLTRPLVRGLVGAARSSGGTNGDLVAIHRAGRALLVRARPRLRACYGSAFSRKMLAAVETTVEATLHADGSVTDVRIVKGGLIDGHGDACIIDALDQVALDEAQTTVARVRVELFFLYENPPSPGRRPRTARSD